MVGGEKGVRPLPADSKQQSINKYITFIPIVWKQSWKQQARVRAAVPPPATRSILLKMEGVSEAQPGSQLGAKNSWGRACQAGYHRMRPVKLQGIAE